MCNTAIARPVSGSSLFSESLLQTDELREN